MSERADDLRVDPDHDPRGLTRGPAVTFTFEGESVDAFTGESIAAALLARGVRTLRTTRIAGAPRGLLCGIGACYDCLVTIEGPERARAVRACVTPVTDGLVVREHDLDHRLAPGDGIVT